MRKKRVAVPEELLALLKESRLGSRSEEDQIKAALAIYLFQEGVISIGKAAELAGEPRASFELALGELGIPAARWDVEDYHREWWAIERAREREA